MKKIKVLTGPLGCDFQTALLDRLDSDPCKEQVLITSWQTWPSLRHRCAQQSKMVQVLSRDMAVDMFNQRFVKDPRKRLDPALMDIVLQQICKAEAKHAQPTGHVRQQTAQAVCEAISGLSACNVRQDKLERLSQTFFENRNGAQKFSDLASASQKIDQALAQINLAGGQEWLWDICRQARNFTDRMDAVFIDAMPAYDALTAEVITAAAAIAKETVVVLPFDAHKASQILLYQEAGGLLGKLKDDGFEVEVIELHQNLRTCARQKLGQAILHGGPGPVAPDDSLCLLSALSPEDEALQVSQQISELLLQGTAPEDILITGASPEQWIDEITRALNTKGIECVEYGRMLNTCKLTGYICALWSAAQDIAGCHENAGHIQRLISYEYFGLSDGQKADMEAFFEGYGPHINQALQACVHEDPQLADSVDHTLNLVRDRLQPLASVIQPQKPFSQWVDALLNFLEHDGTLVRLEQLFDQLHAISPQAAAGLLSQWKGINNLLLSISEALSNQEGSLADFLQVFLSAARKTSAKQACANKKRIQIDSLNAAIGRRPEHLFLVNMNASVFPSEEKYNFLSKEEIAFLEFSGENIDFLKGQTEKERELLARIVLTDCRTVHISWKKSTSQGQPEYLCPFLLNPTRLYPVQQSDVVCQSTAFLERIKSLNQSSTQEEFDSLLAEIRADLQDSPNDRLRLERFLHWKSLDRTQINIEVDAGSYQDRTFSVTRLEKFNGCPFAHFMQYSQHPRPNKVYEASPAAKGNFFHNVLCEVIEKMASGKCDWTDEALIENLAKTAAVNCLHDPLKRVIEENARFAMEEHNLVQTAVAVVKKNCRQIAAGAYKPSFFEQKTEQTKAMSFRTAQGRFVCLVGVIDRIDRFEDKNGCRFERVIDYKTGNVDFDLQALEEGTQLQLPLYLMAACQEHGAKPGGMYYSPVYPQAKKLPKLSSSADQASVCQSQARLNTLRGLTTDSVIAPADAHLAGAGSSYTSPVLPLRLSKGGFNKADQAKCLRTQKDMDDILTGALNKAKETVDRILDGETSALVSPHRQKQCRFCPYAKICSAGLDDSNRLLYK